MANKEYTVVETSKVAAVHYGGHIYSLIDTENDVENGHLGFVGKMAEDIEGVETHEFEKPSTDLIDKQRVVLVANPEWSYDESKRENQALYNYVNEAGRVFCAYDLMAHDMYAVTAGGFNGTPEKDKYVILEDGKTTAKIVDTEEEANVHGFYGKIIGSAKRSLGFTTKNSVVYGHPYTVYFVEVLRNDILATANP